MLGRGLAALGCLGLIGSAITCASGVFMLAMMNDSHLSELGPLGLVVTPLGAVTGLISLVLLGGGAYLMVSAAPKEDNA